MTTTTKQKPPADSPLPVMMDAEHWWAQRWIDKATPGELAAMRELLRMGDMG